MQDPDSIQPSVLDRPVTVGNQVIDLNGRESQKFIPNRELSPNKIK